MAILAPLLQRPARLCLEGCAKPADERACLVGDDRWARRPEAPDRELAAWICRAYAAADLMNDALGIFRHKRRDDPGVKGHGARRRDAIGCHASAPPPAGDPWGAER